MKRTLLAMAIFGLPSISDAQFIALDGKPIPYRAISYLDHGVVALQELNNCGGALAKDNPCYAAYFHWLACGHSLERQTAAAEEFEAYQSEQITALVSENQSLKDQLAAYEAKLSRCRTSKGKRCK